MTVDDWWTTSNECPGTLLPAFVYRTFACSVRMTNSGHLNPSPEKSQFARNSWQIWNGQKHEITKNRQPFSQDIRLVLPGTFARNKPGKLHGLSVYFTLPLLCVCRSYPLPPPSCRPLFFHARFLSFSPLVIIARPLHPNSFTVGLGLPGLNLGWGWGYCVGTARFLVLLQNNPIGYFQHPGLFVGVQTLPKHSV